MKNVKFTKTVNNLLYNIFRKFRIFFYPNLITKISHNLMLTKIKIKQIFHKLKILNLLLKLRLLSSIDTRFSKFTHKSE